MPEARVAARSRQAVIRRSGGCCEYCRSQARFSPDSFSVEHILPRSAGGRDESDNLALSCQGCNNRKYVIVDALDPVSGETVPPHHPRPHHWPPHFARDVACPLVLRLPP